MALVALSAAYGAAGSRIAPALAERLGVPFVDRAIPAAVAERLAVPVDVAVAQEEEGGRGLLERLLSGFVAAETSVPFAPATDIVTSEDFHRAAEEVLMRQASTGRGVILGRGAVAVLRADPRALRVRLTGPRDRRLRQAMTLGGVDEPTARRAMTRLDTAHAAYLRRFYDVSIDDPGLYHIVIDTTTFSVEHCVELIAGASEALGGEPRPSG